MRLDSVTSVTVRYFSTFAKCYAERHRAVVGESGFPTRGDPLFTTLRLQRQGRARIRHCEATTFCTTKGLEVKTVRVETTPARLGQLGGTELQFKCVAPGGEAQPLVKEADQVIELRNC
jgi:hypothetical protein